MISAAAAQVPSLRALAAEIPPYLQNRPAVVPIDVGRQLLVDDYLIDSTTLVRRHHTPSIHPASPVLRPDRDWEIDRTSGNSCAMVYGDAVLWDPSDRQFKLWYMARYGGPTSYATSNDGIHWTKPLLSVVPGTNVVLRSSRDSNTIWLDPAGSPGRRFKMACSQAGGATTQMKYVSPDGITWTSLGLSGPVADRSTMFFNPFLDRWVFSLRGGMGTDSDPRRRQYLDFKSFEDAHWTAADARDWTSADEDDPRRADFKVRPQLYNLDCVAYESVLLGLFTIWRGESTTHHKHNDICVGFSRDGFHWSRPNRQPFIAPDDTTGSWRRTNVQSAGGCCLVVGPNLHFYFSARSGRPGSGDPGVGSTGLAVLRRDGFASMGTDADGTLTTHPVRFGGRELFVNAACRELRVEVLDEQGRAVRGLGRADCQPFEGDSVAARITWRGETRLDRLAGTAVRFRFHLSRGELFSFWVAPDASGASRGYLGNGSPGAEGVVDVRGGRA